MSHYNLRKTRCPNDHEYDSVDARGFRFCMKCKLAQQKGKRKGS